MFEDETPVAWTRLPSEAQVIAADGSEFGVLEMVLGDVEKGIFHGVVVRCKPDGRLVELPASRVKRMTEGHIVTDLAPADAVALPYYQ
jgi:hypothetical protein